MRDDFTIGVKEELAKRVVYLCSNPGCRQPTSGPQSTPSGTVNMASLPISPLHLLVALAMTINFPQVSEFFG